MKFMRLLLALAMTSHLTAAFLDAADKGTNRAPVIKHEPVSNAVKGQSLSIRALVSDDSPAIKSVTLFYTTSRDAAPFKIAMQSTGAHSYIGVIPSALIRNLNEISYYIEALDEQDLASETPWYNVKMQVPQQTASPAMQTQAPLVAQPAAGQVEEAKRDSWSWKGPAIIAGGAAAVIGGALIAANSHGSDSSSDDDGSSGTGGSITNAGTYTGNATKYLEMPGSTPSSQSYPITITVLSSGTLSTDTLHPGVHMESQLSGTEFQMSAAVSESNLTGQVTYIGTLLNNRITGSIAGTTTSSTGTNGTYSGIFSATKQ